MNNQQSTVNRNSFLLLRRRALAVLLLLLAAHCSLLTAFAKTPTTSTREQRLAVFNEVWNAIRERYYDARLRGVNWSAQREIYRNRAVNAANTGEFYHILKQMVGTLHDSHTRVFAPEEKSDWRNPRFISVGGTIREIENELIFTVVEKNSLADRAGIHVGDTLTSVDGVPAATIFARRIGEQTGASTAAMQRLRAAAGIFEGAADSFVQVGFRDSSSGKERVVSLRREWRTIPVSIRARREGAILIIAFDAFAPEIVREFFQILQTNMRGVRGVVLDLRANRGGSTEAMTDIASAFLPENQKIGNFIDRTGKTEVEAHTRRWLLYSASAVRVPNLPIVVLTSTATASAAEIFTASLKKANRAQTVGTTTCGCVLAIKGQHALPDGGVLEISELDYQMPDGSRLEGIGVAPDEQISLTRKELLARRDRALERAIEKLKS